MSFTTNNKGLMKLLYSIFLLSNVVIISHGCNIFNTQYTVRITNGLIDSRDQVKVHCSTDGQDNGFVGVDVDSPFTFTVCKNYIWSTTKSVCHFVWSRTNKDAIFEVFNSDIAEYCKAEVCEWTASSDTIWLRNKNDNELSVSYHWGEHHFSRV